jgi:hypothetical protein
MSDLLPLPDAEDPDALDRWIAARLDSEDIGVKGWRKALLGDDPSQVIGRAEKVRGVCMSFHPALARSLSRLAAERGLSREEFIRAILARQVAAYTGEDPVRLMHLMPPRNRT